MLAGSLPDGDGDVLELGSGAGFLDAYIPRLITSEVFPCSGIQTVLDARRLPIPDGTLKGIVMVDVLHHIPSTRDFLSEAQRCLRPGGCITMIEPWVSTWSTLIYRNLHSPDLDRVEQLKG